MKSGPQNILVITYWSYDDALIQTYTLPYVKIIQKYLPIGSKIYLLTLEKFPDQVGSIRIRGELEENGIEWLPQKYNPFGFQAIVQWIKLVFTLRKFILLNRIETIHCWCTPAGAAGYLLSVITGRRLIIDSYEPHAEAMVENGTWKKNGLAFRLLFWLEAKQTKRASYLIAATESMKAYMHLKYEVKAANFFAKPACVNLELFSEEKIKNTDLLKTFSLTDKIVCVYAGKLGGIYLDKEVFDFLKIAFDYWGHSFRALFLTSHARSVIEEYCIESKLDPNVVIVKFVPHKEVPAYMGLADFALTPVKPVPTKRYCTPIKNGEYWALGLPVVIPNHISDDSDIIIKHNIGAVWRSLDEESYREAVIKIDTLIKTPDSQRYAKIRQVAIQYRSFEIAENVYRSIYGG
ncbi:MAG: hypothetical protein K2U26_14450 [Cyclobacteriaceae bacterium]|nr:hypothetical protein [Cyclobacteriaceae bacterium]